MMMKRLLCAILVILMMIVSANAENVVQKKYSLTKSGDTYTGLYTGEFVKGKPEGYGLFTIQNALGISWHYIGFWQSGLMHGNGATYWDDGTVEIGIYNKGSFVGSSSLDSTGLKTKQNSSITQSSTKKKTYIGNKKSKIFHYPSCNSVSSMKESNKITLNSRQQAISHGYKSCGNCNP